MKDDQIIRPRRWLLGSGQVLLLVLAVSASASIPHRDAVGNRTQVRNNGTNTSYSVNSLNQYSSVGGTNLTYDTRGNLSGGNGASYFYDAINRMVGAAYGTNGAAFAYDALNRCVRRTINGVTTYLYYDGWNLIEERNEGDQVVARYVHGQGVDEVLSMARGGTNYYYHADGLGSVSHLTDSTGTNVVEKYTYDVFGQPSIFDSQSSNLVASAVGNRFLFTGREYLPEVGIYDYRNRMYSASFGRFLQPDPIGFAAGDINLYRYCENNPVDQSDPDGLMPNVAVVPSCPPPRIGPVGAGLIGAGVVGAGWWAATTAWNSYMDYAGAVNEWAEGPFGELPYEPCKLDSADTTDPDAPPLPGGSGGGTTSGSPKATSKGGGGGPAIGGTSPATPPGPTLPPPPPGTTKKGSAPQPAATTPKPNWPSTAQEMDEFLKMSGKRIPDTLGTPGRGKVEWRPNPNTKITFEQHPYDPTAPDWHKGPHYHLDTPGIKPHQRFVPGNPIPGY